MAKLRYKSIIPNSKPYWLLKLQMDVSEQNNYLPFTDLETLKSFIEDRIRSLIEDKTICRSLVETEVREDNGKATLIIFRNRIDVQTYYFEE